MDNNRIEIEVATGKKLVAEVGSDCTFKEIFIYLEGENFTQDLAIVGEQLAYVNGEPTPIAGKYRVLVFGNKRDESYTEHFEIREREEK